MMDYQQILLGLGGIGCILMMCIMSSSFASIYFISLIFNESTPSPPGKDNNVQKVQKPTSPSPSPSPSESPNEVSLSAGTHLLKIGPSNSCIKNDNGAIWPDAACTKSDNNYHWHLSVWSASGISLATKITATTDATKKEPVLLVKNMASDKCIYSSRDGRFNVSTCEPTYNDQQWVPFMTSDRKMRIKNINSEKCLTLTTDGKIVHAECSDMSNVLFEKI